MRRHRILIVIAALVCLAGSGATEAADFKVIGHSATTPDSITKKGLSRLFLKQRTSWPTGVSAEPVDLRGTPRVRQQFCEQILRRSPDMVESYWQGQVFAGKATPPPTMSSEGEIVDFVRRTPGAVGYVSPDADTSGTKTIQITD